MNQREKERLQAALFHAHAVCQAEDQENQARIRAEMAPLRLASLWKACAEPWQD